MKESSRKMMCAFLGRTLDESCMRREIWENPGNLKNPRNPADPRGSAQNRAIAYPDGFYRPEECAFNPQERPTGLDEIEK